MKQELNQIVYVYKRGPIKGYTKGVSNLQGRKNYDYVRQLNLYTKKNVLNDSIYYILGFLVLIFH